MAVPGATTRVIGDLVPGVIRALQERTDVASIAPVYIKRALEEITESYPFEELRRVGPTTTLSKNVADYPVSQFLSSGDDVTSVEVWTIYIDPPTNTTKITLKYKTPQALEMISSPSTVGIPAYWTRFGSTLTVGPVPLQSYTTFMKYQVRHPFPDDLTNLSGMPIFVPSSWEEIVEYSAAERIAFVKRWNDQVDRCHNILYGDPEFQASEGKRGRPGIIAARLMQVERDVRFNSRSLGIRVGRYSSR